MAVNAARRTDERRGADGAGERPSIYLSQGELDRVVREAAEALQEAGVAVYRFGDALVRLVTVDASAPGDPVHRDPAMQVLRPVVPNWIALRLSEVARFWRFDVRAGEYRASDPPPRVASMVLDAGDELGFASLVARAACPQLLPDGRIQGHGFDSASGLLVDAPGTWPGPPADPSHRCGKEALERLRALFKHYPWQTPGAESAAVAALLTACIRATLPSAPLFAITAPLSGAGTGKSLLARAIATVATGRGPTAITWPATPGEGAKRLDATHLAGDLVITIDNASGPLDDDALCTALTEPTRDIRELGSSRTSRTPMVATHFATGNALTIRGDLTRRTVMIALDPQTDAPDQRDIPQDLIEECRVRRGEILRDVHTILLAYQAAGSPDMGLRPMGDYRAWTRRVRSPLVWLGLPDPANTQEALRADDPQRDARVALFTAWHETFGGGSADGATAREAVELVADAGTYHHLPDEVVERLRDAIEAVAMRRGKVDTGALGRWLRSAKDARVGDLVMTGRSGHGGRTRWVVTRDGGDGGDTGGGVVDSPGGDGGHGGVPPSTLRGKCQGMTDTYKGRGYGDPHHGDHHHQAVLAAAVDGLDVSVAELRAALSPEDMGSIASGDIGANTVRAFALDLAARGGST